MPFDPASLDLKSFVDPAMFDSSDTWRAAGFDIVRASERRVIVASHVSLPGYLLKKFPNSIPADEQLENYDARVEGARRLMDFIAKRSLQHITVPHKWICDLPANFASRKILIVERLDVVPGAVAERLYRDISKEVLRELCMVLSEFRGLDSALHNVGFTTAGKIAFIDTENWDRSKKTFMGFIQEHLSDKSKDRAKRFYKKYK